jgi:hypothetical protein
VVALLVACGCSTAAAQRKVELPELAVRGSDFEEGKRIQLDAWVKLAGEVELYDTRRAADLDLVYPYCISASFADYSKNYSPNLEGKRVRASGVIYRPEPTRSDATHIQTQQIAHGIIFANNCFGPYLLAIESMEEVPQPNSRRRP